MRLTKEFSKPIETNQSPDSVLPAPRHFPDAEKMNSKPNQNRRDEILRVKEGFTEISFRRYRSSSCKNVSSKPMGMENKIEVRRGSVYQSSKEVKETRKPVNYEGRMKIELSRSSNASFSFRITEGKEESKERNTRTNTDLSSSGKSSSNPCLANSYIDLCLNSGIKDRAVGLERTENSNSGCVDEVGPLNLDKDHLKRLSKSLSPKGSKSDKSIRQSSRSRLGQIQGELDPFVKSKSLRSPLGFKLQDIESKSMDKTFCKSLSSSSSVVHQKNSRNLYNRDLEVKSSPVHLHGRLKLEIKHGLPVFEFSLDCPDDVYVAKTWKSSNDSSWVYTFHSVGGRKKSNASAWSLNESSRDSLMVGQMQVSCFMCTELKKDGSDLDNSMVTEFVLYDIARARRSSVSKGNTTDADLHSREQDDRSDAASEENRPKRYSESSDVDGLNEPKPWPAADLHPNLEIAAIVIQDLVERRESLKYKRGDKKITDKMNLLSLSIIEENKKESYRIRNPEKLKVVIPMGNHGLPIDENCGPSPLLQRWRLGGGCDCGGWDMACPLVVFGNPRIQCAYDQPLVDNQHPLELLVQGAKGSTPALSMEFVEEGHYEVDFHAQLSALQAFSICVSMLHNAEASGISRNENAQFLQSDSLKMLMDNSSMEFLVEAVTEEEKKDKVPKTRKAMPPSYMPIPPFSPIARV